MENTNTDPYLWLEEIQSPKSKEWVEHQNQKTLGTLHQYKMYPQLKKEIQSILEAKDRIPRPSVHGEWVYDFWQSPDHVRGQWRRTPFSQFVKPHPVWTVLLDLDLLAKAENQNWTWHGCKLLNEKGPKVLIELSDGGKDAVTIKEFDLESLQFLQNGFYLPPAKSTVAWLDENHILFSTDFGPNSLTDSGYPRIVKIWERGKSLNDAVKVLEVPKTRIWTMVHSHYEDGKLFAFVDERLSFFQQKTHFIADRKFSNSTRLEPLDIPEDSEFKGWVKNYAYFILRKPWKTFSAGTLLRMDTEHKSIQTVFVPSLGKIFGDISFSKDHIVIHILEKVKSQVFSLDYELKSTSYLSLPKTGSVAWIETTLDSNSALIRYEDFLTPATIYLASLDSKAISPIKSLPTRFDSYGMKAEQYFATSKDGERVPYFLILPPPNKIQRGAPIPTILYGYGGFEVSLTPTYPEVTGKAWLEKGGAYVIANIRGGGEFGPEWHQAALLQNRQRAYDDFIAVAENLIAKKVTTSQHLGILGGSNGGLLVGAVLTQKPSLFGAAVCAVPLLDMLRYHHLLAGASWVGEYGNPDIPEEKKWIEKYSPYQNLRSDRKYPEVFIMTSTYDDRVHPGHARKFAARMEEFKHPFMYFENFEGGHGGSANLKQQIEQQALRFSYFWKLLSDNSKN